jgi:hypothetical protein
MREIVIVCVMAYGTITYPVFVISDDISSSYVWNGRQLQRTIYYDQYNKLSFLFGLRIAKLEFFLVTFAHVFVLAINKSTLSVCARASCSHSGILMLTPFLLMILL